MLPRFSLRSASKAFGITANDDIVEAVNVVIVVEGSWLVRSMAGGH